MQRNVFKSKLFWGFVLALLLIASGFVFLQMRSAHGQHSMHGHGSEPHQHDEVNMPGLRGENVRPEETAEMQAMFRGFEQISRSVENLPNGIRAVTFSEDEELMSIISSHVIGMIDRVETGDDPKVFIQSPTLDIFFERRDTILTDIDITDEGIVVTQTSDDPETVKALQLHAAEVTAMADRGMQAVHQMMMERQGKTN